MHGIPVEGDPTDNEAENLLAENEDCMEMAELDPETTRDPGNRGQQSHVDGRYTDGEPLAEASGSRSIGDGDEVVLANEAGERLVEYRVYKIRWFGLAQLILLNIVVSWDVCCFTSDSTRKSRILTLDSGSPSPQLSTQRPTSSSRLPALSTGLAPLSSSPS